MYGGGSAGVVSTVAGATVTAVALPNTGGANNIVAISVSVFLGLFTWGVVYLFVNQ